MNPKDHLARCLALPAYAPAPAKPKKPAPVIQYSKRRLSSYSCVTRVRGRWTCRALIFIDHWQPSRAAARKVYAKNGNKGRIELNRTKAKKRGKKHKPAPPPECMDCNDYGWYESWRDSFDGPYTVEEPCDCRAGEYIAAQLAAKEAQRS